MVLILILIVTTTLLFPPHNLVHHTRVVFDELRYISCSNISLQIRENYLNPINASDG